MPCNLDFTRRRADAAGLIRNLQHLRSRRVGAQHFADDSLRRNDRHVGLDAVVGTAVDVDDVRCLGTAGSDHLRGDRLGNVLFFELEQRLYAARLCRILLHANLLQPHVLDLLAKLDILAAHSTQIEILVPCLTNPLFGMNEAALERSDEGHGPLPYQPHRTALRRPLDLRCQAEDLRHQHNGEDGRVLVPGEKGFHKNSFMSFEFQVCLKEFEIATQFRQDFVIVLQIRNVASIAIYSKLETLKLLV